MWADICALHTTKLKKYLIITIKDIQSLKGSIKILTAMFLYTNRTQKSNENNMKWGETIHQLVNMHSHPCCIRKQH
jgi:hypothetical protein